MADEVIAPDPRYYPKAKYCVDGSHCVVANRTGEAALDPEMWFDNPSQAKAALEAKPVVDSDESWEASEALLQPKRRGRPPKVTIE